MDKPVEVIDFIALLLFVGASILGLSRAWMSYNLENAVVGKSAISFTRYFFRHLDESVMDIRPNREKYEDKKIDNKRKNLNKLTYTIYVLYLLSIVIYFSGHLIEK